MTTPDFWNARYSEPELAYGDEPNDFLRSVADQIPPGPVLCLAEGQGRNAVFLAGLGHPTTAVDLSEVGLRRAAELAASRGVALQTVVADLSTWTIPKAGYSAIVSIFAHLPAEARARLHGQVAAALAPGGLFILEAYGPAQLALATGGPRDPSLLAPLEVHLAENPGLRWLHTEAVEREIREGRYHAGPSAVVQLVGTPV